MEPRPPCWRLRERPPDQKQLIQTEEFETGETGEFHPGLDKMTDMHRAVLAVTMNFQFSTCPKSQPRLSQVGIGGTQSSPDPGSRALSLWFPPSLSWLAE